MPKDPVQVHIDRALKKRVKKIFEKYGLDMSSAVRVFFKKVDLTGGIPFDLRDDQPEFSKAEMKEIEEAYRESFDPKNLSGPFDSVDEMFKHMEMEDPQKSCN